MHLGQPALSAAVGDAVEPDVRGVALGVSTLLFLVGGSVGSAVVAGLSGVLGLGGALAFGLLGVFLGPVLLGVGFTLVAEFAGTGAAPDLLGTSRAGSLERSAGRPAP